MVEVASMQIKGTLDSTEIENSLRRIEQKLSGFGAQAKSATGSVSRLADMAKSLSKTLIAIGSTGVAALTGLASKAPAVAPALAKMQIGLMQISHTLGRILSPLFESVANELIPAIGSAIDRFSPQISSFVNMATEGISKFSTALREFDLSKLIPFTAFALAGAAAGFALGGWGGAFIGLALGAALGTAIIPTTTPESKEKYGAFAETATAYQQQLEIDPMTDFGKSQLYAGRTIVNSIIDSIEWAFKRLTNKERAFASKNSS